MILLQKIVSGGQTGSDRGGLNAAIHLGIPHGGFCPKGRLAEDGVIPRIYKLTETISSAYPPRTSMNVLQSDGTIVFTYGAPERGSALTIELARRHQKPCLHINIDPKSHVFGDTVDTIREWLERNEIHVLNVAGNRESRAPGIQAKVKEILVVALRSPSHGHEEPEERGEND